MAGKRADMVAFSGPGTASAGATGGTTDVRNEIYRESGVDTAEAALTQKLEAADIAFARVNATADLAVHPQLRRIEIATPSGVVSYPAPPARSDATPPRYGAVPALGEHTAKIWAEFLPGKTRPGASD